MEKIINYYFQRFNFSIRKKTYSVCNEYKLHHIRYELNQINYKLRLFTTLSSPQVRCQLDFQGLLNSTQKPTDSLPSIIRWS